MVKNKLQNKCNKEMVGLLETQQTEIDNTFRENFPPEVLSKDKLSDVG